MKRKFTVLLTVLALIISIFQMPVMAEDNVTADSVSYSSPRQNSNGDTVWDCVWFGNYWQNDTNGDGTADTSDGKEPIKWRVLYATSDDLFLISESLLDAKPFNTTSSDVTWEESTIRSWLNGYDSSYNTCGEDYSGYGFINDAFSSAEISAIKTTNVDNSISQGKYDRSGGENTIDKLFFLSYKETINESYGFSPKDSKYDWARMAKPTKFAVDEGAYESDSGKYSGNGWWWLRSPGSISKFVIGASKDGHTGTFYTVINSGGSDRPALHISPSSSLISYAGTICSDGTVDEVSPGNITVENYSVTFDSNGGSSVSNQTVSKGGLAKKPSDPTKDGYTFTGWYIDQACTNAYDFNTAVTQSFTLYAGWEVKNSVTVTITPSTATIEIGQVIILTATVTPTDAANKNVTWSTSDSSVAIVDDGVLTGVGAGKATITVKTEDGNKTATCEVTVNKEQQDNESFVIGVDNNHFANSYSDFFNNGVERRYTFKNSNYLSQLKSLDTNKILGLEDWMKMPWGGSCFGIASTMGLVKLGKLSVNDITRSGVGNYHSLQKPVSDSILFDSINYYQVGQFICKRSAAIAKTYKDEKNTLKTFLRSLVESTKGNNIVLFCYGDSSSGHAILALNSEYDPSGDRYVVTVYDENTSYGWSGFEPEHTSEFIVSSDFSSFNYTTASNKTLQNIYTRMDIYDLNKFPILDGDKGANTSMLPAVSFDAPGDTVIISLPVNETSQVINSEGKNITLKDGMAQGTMTVYDTQYIDADDASRVQFIVDKVDKYTVTADSVDISVNDSGQIMSLTGSSIENAEFSMSNKTINIKDDGNGYEFNGYISSDEDTLMSLSGSASGETAISLDGTTITASSTGNISNAASTTYSGIDAKTEAVSGSGTGKIEATHEASNSITITPSTAIITVGQTVTLTVNTSASSSAVTWTSSNPQIATVSNGVVTGVSAGNAIITAKVGSAMASAIITVVDSTMTPDETVEVGQKIKINTGKKIKILLVSDKSIAKVTKKGKKIIVKGKKAGKIMVRAYGKKNKLIDEWIIEVTQ